MKPLAAIRPGLRTAWLWVACALSLAAWVWAAGATWQAYCGLDRVAPCSEFGLGLGPLAVAAGYWAIGVVVWRVGGIDAPLEFFLVAATALATGLLSTIPLDIGQRVFYLALAWLGPLMFHAHCQVIRRPLRRAARVLLLSGYAISGLASLPFVFWPFVVLQAQPWYTSLWMGVRLGLIGFLGVTLVYTGYLYGSRSATTGDRQRLRILFLGILLAFAPLVFLSLLPHTLGAPFHVPYIYTFPALLLNPLAYLYVQLRPRLLRWEPLLQRIASYYLLLILLSVLSIVFADQLLRLLPVADADQFMPALLLAVGALAVSLLLLLLPVQWVIGWILNGNDRHLLARVQSVTAELAHTLTLPNLHRLLHDCLVNDFGCTAIVLYEQPNEEQPGAVWQELSGQPNLPALPLRGRLVETLARCREPIETSALAGRLAAGPLAPEEREALAAPLALWLPLHSAATLQGILALGPRRQGELFTARDRQLLLTLAYAAAMTLHNVQLLAAVHAAQNELIEAHQQLSQAREQERRHVAAELHDGVLQQLLGLDYQLHRAQRLAGAAVPDGAGEPFHLLGAARQELAGAVRQLRALLGALHPADLDAVGLRAAVAEYIEQVAGSLGPGEPAVTWDGGDVEPPLPALHQLCVYRCVQEGVRNALRHAQARCIHVRLHWDGRGALVEVVDDGQGFETPARLSQFARRQHFGLIGVEERVHALGGKFAIQSEPGAGTVLQAWIPAAGGGAVQNDDDSGDRRMAQEGA